MGVVQQRGDEGPTAEGSTHGSAGDGDSDNGTPTEEDSKRCEAGGGRGGAQEVPCLAGCRDHKHQHLSQQQHRGDALLGTKEEDGVPWHLCPLCRRPFEDPRVLACLHVFCSACLRRLLLPQLCAVPCEDEEGVEEMEMTAEEGEAGTGGEPATPLSSAPAATPPTATTPAATPTAEGSLVEVDAGSGGQVVSRPRALQSESGRSDSASSSRGPPSLRSWASFKGAWSPRSGRRRVPPTLEDDEHPKTRDPSPRRLGLQRSLTVRSPPTSPPLPRRAHGGSLRAPALPPMPWRKRGSTVPSEAGEQGADGVILLLRCPACGTETPAPTPAGTRRGALSPAAASAVVHAAVAALPLHAVLLHRLHFGRGKAPRPKCDLCSLDATGRCIECSLALCVLCSETHRRQRNTAGHSLVQGEGAPRPPPGRLPPCPHHPGNAQRLFCGPCGRLACRACPCATNHRCEPVAHAARNWAAPAVRTALDKVRPYADNALANLDALRSAEHRVQVRASEVEVEVDLFVDSWVRALEEHRTALKAEAWRARDSKLEALRSRRAGLERQVEGVATAVRFADDLIAEASDAELLGMAGALVRRLDWCRAEAVRALPRAPPPEEPGAGDEGPGAAGGGCPVSLQFLPAERAATIYGHQMYGVVTAQAVCPAKCRISSEGLSNCRQHRKTEAVVVTRDADDQPIGHGGEQVVAELRYRDASHRQLPVYVSDQKDGSYTLTFIPDAAGVLSLVVTVQGKHIQGSPFTVHARTIRAHTGIFHCCTFCSSHGNKEATCACGGKMPGGYKGCGHGHTGHPGRRHWSCCGNVLEGSECGRSNGVSTYTI
ncbi:E3 ubiquitin-protein ligase TRIM45-like isoform X2 [Hetaerina americana]|uniref:E3 ubiquitin-protein ligase TRIM45-like isoform X2 n=1 Tax=Hetaerina americana TaxID=62018 RepID=UPI003A7F490D